MGRERSPRARSSGMAGIPTSNDASNLAPQGGFYLAIEKTAGARITIMYHRQRRWYERCEPLKAVGKPSAT